MRYPLRVLILAVPLVVLACLDQSPTVPTNALSIDLTPASLGTSEWCWAASAEMVLRYYGLPATNDSYQCGVVGHAAGPTSPCYNNCLACASWTGGGITSIQQAINGYGMSVRHLGLLSPVLTSDLLFKHLALGDIATEIAANRLIVAGIAPGGGFTSPNAIQHVVVISGYDFTNGRDVVVVNDPYPYGVGYGQLANPYLAAGGSQVTASQFLISAGALVSKLGWMTTIYRIRVSN